jgi:long-chain acyl-CoA synthetase
LHPRQQAQFHDPAMVARPASPAIAECEIVSLSSLFRARVQRTPQAIACQWFDRGSAQWQVISWSALDAQAEALARSLAALGLPAGSRVALMLENSPEWVAAEQAIYRLGLVSVGIYLADTPGNAAHILEDSGAALLLVRDAALWASIAAERPLPDLQRVVLMRGAGADELRTQTLAAFLAGPQSEMRASASLESLASLVYTSGTTGAAKGAMLTHGALLANVFACQRAFVAGSDEVKLSLLPLSHSFERVAGWYHAVLVGAVTAFSRGPEHLVEDLQLLRPTALLAVPRVYERLYARLAQVLLDGPLPQRALFHLALSESTRRFSRRLTARLIDAVRQRFGGRLRFAISGGAPLSPEIARAFVALGIPLMQGYGLTEAGPVVSVSRSESADPCTGYDSAGEPLDNVETRVAPDGELLVRSPSLMKGYWRDEAASRRVLDESGWLHTGDKASRLCGRSLVLTGRLKDVLVMSTGVKACPAEIESRLAADGLFEQSLVLGESRPYLVALLVAEPSQLTALRRSLQLHGQDDTAQLEQALLERCRVRLAGLPQSHQLCRVALVEPFTLANGQVTTTLKPRRAMIARAHAALIDSLYAGHCHTYKSDCASNAEARQQP